MNDQTQQAMMGSPLHLREGLRQKLPQMLALLERLVNIDSGSYDRAGVNRVSAILVAELQATGFAIARNAMPDCGDQVIATRPCWVLLRLHARPPERGRIGAGSKCR